MRTENFKILGALASGLSVAVTLGVATNLFADSRLLTTPLIAATVGAAIAAVMSILSTRYLRRERSKGRVFIIYAHEDQEAAERLYATLNANGFAPWLDKFDIMPGQVWSKSILNAIEGSQVALALISPASVSKEGFIQKELKTALAVMQGSEEGLSPVIPVRLSDVEVPESLRDIQWVNLFADDGDKQLIRALHSRAKNRPTQPTMG